MKRTQIFILALAVTISAVAANFTGKIVDEQGLPFAFANVVLLNASDSAFVSGTMTDDAGTFSLTSEQSSVIVKISYIGYETKCINATAGDLGTIQLQPEATMLGEVVVKGERPTYRLTTEGIKTDVEGTLLSHVGDANDVLGNLPGVQKKNDGIEVFGKGAPLIYINGRQLRNMNELEQIKSDNIKSVELIINPGAKYKADVGAVILIKTKRPQGDGFSFDASATFNQGHRASLSSGIRWNYRHRGLDVFGTVWYADNSWMQGDIMTLDVKADTIWHLEQDIYNRNRVRHIFNTLGFNYVFNDNHSIGLKYDTQWMITQRARSKMAVDVTANGEFYDHLDNIAIQKGKNKMPHTMNAYYNGHFGNTSVDLNLDYVYFKDRMLHYNDEKSQERDSRVVTAEAKGRNQMFAGKLMLSWPLWGGNLSAGSEITNTHRNDEYLNPENIVPSSSTEQRESNYAFFLEYVRTLPFGQMRLGLRNENVSNEYFSMGVKVADLSRTYHHFFPSVGLAAKAGNVQLMLNYASKIQRPYYYQLNGSVTYSNRFTWESGNPLLKPSIKHQVGLTTMYKWATFMIDYERSKDVVARVANEVPGNESITLLNRANVDHEDLLTLMLNLAPKFGIYEPQLSLVMNKEWIKIPSPAGFISPKRPLFSIGFNNNIRILPTLFASANLNIQPKGDFQNATLTKATVKMDVSLTKTFLNNRLSIKVAGYNLLNAKEYLNMNFGLRNINTVADYGTRKLQVTVRYKFNATQSKYKGTGAGQEERSRLGN